MKIPFLFIGYEAKLNNELSDILKKWIRRQFTSKGDFIRLKRETNEDPNDQETKKAHMRMLTCTNTDSGPGQSGGPVYLRSPGDEKKDVKSLKNILIALWKGSNEYVSENKEIVEEKKRKLKMLVD